MINIRHPYKSLLPAAVAMLLSAASAGTAQSEEPLVIQVAQADAKAEEREGENPAAEQRAQWNEREAKLLEALAAATAQVARENASASEDWAAVERGVADLLYQRSAADRSAHSDWPVRQSQWVSAIKKRLEREGEKDQEGRRDHTLDITVLEALSDALASEAEENVAQDTPDGGQAQDGDDENVWKFRDKSGARTTKPRYKGQEPVN